MKRSAILWAGWLAFVCGAYAVDVERVIDFTQPVAPEITAYQGSEMSIRWQVKSRERIQNITGYSGLQYWATTNTATQHVAAACTLAGSTTGYFRSVWSRTDLNTNGVFMYGIGLESNGTPVIARQGVLRIIPDPYGAPGAGALGMTTSVVTREVDPHFSTSVAARITAAATTAWWAAAGGGVSESRVVDATSSVPAWIAASTQALGEAVAASGYATGAVVRAADLTAATGSLGLAVAANQYVVPAGTGALWTALGSISSGGDTGPLWQAHDAGQLSDSNRMDAIASSNGAAGEPLWTAASGTVVYSSGALTLTNAWDRNSNGILDTADSAADWAAVSNAVQVGAKVGAEMESWTNNIASHIYEGWHGTNALGGVWLGIGATVTGNGGAIGQAAHAGSGGAVGDNASVEAGAAVGDLATATGEGVALGYRATAGDYAVQIGEGTNTEDFTLNVWGRQLIDTNGFVPMDRFSGRVPTNVSAGGVMYAITNGIAYGPAGGSSEKSGSAYTNYFTAYCNSTNPANHGASSYLVWSGEVSDVDNVWDGYRIVWTGTGLFGITVSGMSTSCADNTLWILQLYRNGVAYTEFGSARHGGSGALYPSGTAIAYNDNATNVWAVRCYLSEGSAGNKSWVPNGGNTDTRITGARLP